MGGLKKLYCALLIVITLSSSLALCSDTYESIKSELVEFVASEFPLIPDRWRDDLRDVLAMALDYGLISMGVPPSLPNFDELTSLGADYLAATALEQAGVPTSELGSELR